jgi:hypothetical protein
VTVAAAAKVSTLIAEEFQELFSSLSKALLVGGQLQQIDFPGATDTRCNSFSDTLEIGGRYTDQSGKIHGFLVK